MVNDRLTGAAPPKKRERNFGCDFNVIGKKRQNMKIALDTAL
jgi:hypothetical protein